MKLVTGYVYDYEEDVSSKGECGITQVTLFVAETASVEAFL